ncbi:MAG: GNAT family N-acetyltransferase, partial [Byssovorax sp.]
EEELSRPWARLWAARTAVGAPLAGFLISWHVADELHVLNIATLPELRRRGVGRALMAEGIRYASEQKIRIVLLEVRRTNRAAIKLYRGLAFTALSVRAGYYADNGEDAIEMILALDPESGAILPGRDEIRIDG